ncbi:glycoside hydrolase family 15 protein [Nocardia asteroides NBRC 15531]|uniref:Glycosidase n=1 Tax=Nocardia asteroides NBRC 15531 TaxID=1110697 RepID=U5E8G5_NOCAS|nr:glycoside hydrolase family 15 protein [Nocardia asteroides]TLF67088.1 glycoside hydrolase family 15 protein [Nocardia asteroides NBRC 15531]UGT51641.1 glycoside hydrolase family 15 protein [Nocardia asteroides]SFM20800.1 Glucoamylase (glucan-1,4-alpha-glucosidase), GH15 family [Nocardia asteroides]VEG35458.1 Trehalase [Nocardia asteroides]GAD86382.1 putative glycosidase [Nocardia asteroides NBRC 15531]
MNAYPPIDEHGIVGDLQTAALVSAAGTIDWWCAPRFDSPSVFASLLDSEKGGHCSIAVDTSHQVTVRQLYMPDTAILVTRFCGPDGVGEVADFMVPITGGDPVDRHRLVRVARVVRGSLRFALECRPRFDYARATHTLDRVDERTAVFRSPDADLHLQTTDPIALHTDGVDSVAHFTLAAGERAAVVLTTAAPGASVASAPTWHAIADEFERCRTFWQTWLRASTYRGRWRDMVNRSAITLKLLTYAPTGAPIAAATMGLPEQIGGERNWDYRYTWIRDASLSVRALMDLGFTEEAYAFRQWLRARVEAGGTASGEPLQIMYRIDGDPNLEEVVLDHLSGYRNSAPVRLGNGAADQIQLDIYGEAADALAQSTDMAAIGGWQTLAGIVDWLADHWDRPDEGIWETRGGRQEFTYSRLMTWVAFDRAIRLATEYARPADLARWTAERDAVFRQIVTRGWSEKRQAFVQHYATDVLDASLLLMPRMGFLSPTDPMWLSTLDAMDHELVSDSLVYRYDPAASPDGLRGTEGTFNLCSFLYVEALARTGRVQQARYAFDKMLTYANHVGLFAEEIGPSGEQLGNFPQAFTHLAVIAAALALDEELDRAESRPPTARG